MWWSLSVEGLLSTGTTPSSFTLVRACFKMGVFKLQSWTKSDTILHNIHPGPFDQYVQSQQLTWALNILHKHAHGACDISHVW